MSKFNKSNDKPELKENYQDLSFISRKIRMICLELLKVIRNDPNAKPFLEPVDWEGLDLPNYPQIIKKPMDLQTVGLKLDQGLYENSLEFYQDVKLIWFNAMTYNCDGSKYYLAAEEMNSVGMRIQ